MIPVAAAGAAGLAVAAATRSDGVGDAARATGNAAVTGLAKAKEFEEKNQIGAKLKTIGEGAVAKVNALKLLLRESVKCACKCKLIATRFTQAKDVNEKYHVVDNVKVSLPTHARTHARTHANLEKQATTLIAHWRLFALLGALASPLCALASPHAANACAQMSMQTRAISPCRPRSCTGRGRGSCCQGHSN